MDKVKELLQKEMIISEKLQELYLKDIEKHQATKIVLYCEVNGIKIPETTFFIEKVNNEKVKIMVDGLDFIEPHKRTYKKEMLKNFTGLFSKDFDIYYY